ncbi:adrenodoxin-like protein 1 [Quercus suber]|uniref:Adrenodoxin-like protein 1 n=1 Tax=Quercus suber TaxID=58331 RepID=A0AAW0M0I3_QUESU
MLLSKVSKGRLWNWMLLRQLSTPITRAGYIQRPYNYSYSYSYNHYLQPLFDPQTETKVVQGSIFQKQHHFSTTTTSNASKEGGENKESISVTFVDKDGEEKHLKVPIGMSMLEAAHENDIELEGKDSDTYLVLSMRRFTCLFDLSCDCEGMFWIYDMEYYNKLEEPTDEENDMLDLAFGLTETSRLGCQVIAKSELDGIRLAIPAATRNFAVDGYVPKPH